MTSARASACAQPEPPQPDPCLDEEEASWSTLHCLSSLRLTLSAVLCDSTTPRVPPLLEFPLNVEVISPEIKLELPLRTQPPGARLRSDQLSLKASQLRSTVGLYRQRLNQLQQGSRAVFGEIRGQRICLMVVDSSSYCAFPEEEDSGSGEEDDGGERDGEGKKERSEFSELKHNLKQLFEEQLSKKRRVYLLQLGSEDPDSSPTLLNFSKNRKRSMLVAEQWVEGLKGGSVCNLLTGLEKGMALTDIDTLLIIIGSKPQEEKKTLLEFLRGRNDGGSPVHIHWVAHLCNTSTRDMLGQLASETGAQYHSYSRTRDSGNCCQEEVEDTKIQAVRSELNQAEEVTSDLDLLQSGIISDNVLHTLLQLNMTCCKFEDEVACRDIGNRLPVTSREWLVTHSLEASGLSIYRVLAPNAYRQVKTTVTRPPDTPSIIPSVVYDETMPQFTWHDGTLKYLHVDVHQLEDYQVEVERHVLQLRRRLNWLASGSRAPFGVIFEKNVQLMVEFTGATLPFVCQLQNSLRLLLFEQLSHTQRFNLTRIGEESSSWRRGLTQTTPQALSNAWVWLLGQAPSGSAAGLIPALETAFTAPNQGRESSAVGVYLILSSLPRESIEALCSFLEEKTSSHRNTHVNVMFYWQSPPSESQAVAGIRFEEGYYADEQELTRCLKQIASAGKGRFHSFKGPDTVSSDDLEELARELGKAQDQMKMAGKILTDYRSFCKRCVPPPVCHPPPPAHCDPPPLYPRATTASLCRLNAVPRRIPRSASDSQLSGGRLRQTGHTRRTKTCVFYLDRSLEKGLALERWASFGSPTHGRKRQISEPRSTSEWLLRYGLESLHLRFSQFEVRKRHRSNKKKTYRHINEKGEIVELYTDRRGLKTFVQRLSQAKETYTQKLSELGKGWRNTLGVISESKVLLLIDVSSSMAGCFKELQTALLDFLQNRPHTLTHLNLVVYSSSVRRWQETLSPVSDEIISAAAEWVSQLRPEGSSCLLQALKLSMETGVKNIYLITDGTADHTHDFLLSQLPQLRMWYGRHWKMNTIAFHCSLESSFCFLRELAHRTGGRYHSYPWGTAVDSSTKLLQNRFLGDDVVKLVQEISTAEHQLHKASCYL